MQDASRDKPTGKHSGFSSNQFGDDSSGFAFDRRFGGSASGYVARTGSDSSGNSRDQAGGGVEIDRDKGEGFTGGGESTAGRDFQERHTDDGGGVRSDVCNDAVDGKSASGDAFSQFDCFGGGATQGQSKESATVFDGQPQVSERSIEDACGGDDFTTLVQSPGVSGFECNFGPRREFGGSTFEEGETTVESSIVDDVVVPLKAYSPFVVGDQPLSSLEFSDAEWLANEYYFLLATMHVARCTTTLDSANEMRVHLTSPDYKSSLLQLYSAFRGEDRCEGFHRLSLQLFMDEITVQFLWKSFDKVYPRVYLQSAALFFPDQSNMDDDIRRMLTWQNRTVLQFDYKLIMVAIHSFPKQYVTACENTVLNLDQFDKATEGDRKFTSSVTKNHTQFFLNYSGGLRFSVVYLLRKNARQLRQTMHGEIIRVKSEKGWCSVCECNVVLDAHHERCRPKVGNKVQSNDWIGDALLALDIRLILSSHQIPDNLLGGLYAGYTSNVALKEYLGLNYPDRYFEAASTAGTHFEQHYLTLYRHEYLQYVSGLLGERYALREFKLIEPEKQILMIALGIERHIGA